MQVLLRATERQRAPCLTSPARVEGSQVRGDQRKELGMSTRNPTCFQAPLGTVTTTRIDEPAWARGVAAVSGYHEYVWTPAAHFGFDQLPSRGRIVFHVAEERDTGARRFVPHDQFDEFIDQAFHAGHTIRTRDEPAEVWHQYLLAKFLYDRMQHVRERAKGQFGSARDLTISKSGREGRERGDVLPDDLGLDSTGQGKRWTVDNLLDAGREAFGNNRACTIGQAIAWGLLEGAKRRVSTACAENPDALIRQTLFDLSQCEGQTPDDVQDDVRARLLGLIHDHLGDSREGFNKWFKSGSSNLTTALVKKANCTPLTTNVVRRALLDLGWRAYHTVGECIECFARAFVDALPEPLTAVEQRQFEATFFGQRYFGGLPLPLLLAQSSVIEPAVMEIWNNPDDEQLISAFHRVLHWHAEMVAKRRTADRRIKQVRDGGGPRGRNTGPRASGDDMQLVFREIFERRPVECPCGRVLHGESEDLVEGQPFKLQAWCEEHGLIATLEVTWDDLETVIRWFDGD